MDTNNKQMETTTAAAEETTVQKGNTINLILIVLLVLSMCFSFYLYNKVEDLNNDLKEVIEFQNQVNRDLLYNTVTIFNEVGLEYKVDVTTDDMIGLDF